MGIAAAISLLWIAPRALEAPALGAAVTSSDRT
jgi:hypothetical protein